jgi:hypothetical protein
MKKMNAVVQAPNLELRHINCLECGESIFNPICPECILRHFNSWISIYPSLKYIEKSIIKFIKKNRIFHNHSQTCISCKKDNVYLCPYCFTKYIYKLLKQAKISRLVLGEFLFLFNYDFEHTGYYKEGERLGIF